MPTMNSLEKLQQRKAQLQQQMEQEKEALKNTLLDIREEVEPVNLLKKLVGGLIGPAKTSNGSLIQKTVPPLLSLATMLLKNSRWVVLAQWLAPLALRWFAPDNTKETSAVTISESTEKQVSKNIYRRLRQSISTLRAKLRKKETPDDNPLQNIEN
jgi:hypothetical protein